MSFNNSKLNSSERGFTIVELLIVVVVIAILAAITIVSYNGITNRANASAAASLASNLQRKSELFLNDGPTGNYPRAITDVTGGSAGTTTITGVTSRPTTSADSWYIAHGSVTPVSSLTASNGRTSLIYTVCGSNGTSTTAPTTIAGITIISGVSIQYFDFEAGTGTRTISLGNPTTSTGASARGCVAAAS
jgi:prepilin-type N-terminal cleavage/methylation domain-containing protein